MCVGVCVSSSWRDALCAVAASTILQQQQQEENKQNAFGNDNNKNQQHTQNKNNNSSSSTRTRTINKTWSKLYNDICMLYSKLNLKIKNLYIIITKLV